MIISTTLFLVAGRFGLAPTANRNASAGLKLSENKAAGLYSNDPAGELKMKTTKQWSKAVGNYSEVLMLFSFSAGFTAVDVLALGALGHIVGVGTVLGLRATGNL